MVRGGAGGRLAGSPARRPPHVVLVLAAVVVPLVVLAAVAVLVRAGGKIGWDTSILRWMYRHHRRPLTLDVRAFTNTGSFAVVGPLTLVAALLLAWRRRGRAAAYLAVTVLAALALNGALKVAFHRAPPHVFVPVVRESAHSFPSGHTMNATALAVCLIVVAWRTRWRWIALVGASAYALAVGLSRLYLGVHYPTDVLGGWAFSLALALGLALVFGVGGRGAEARAAAGGAGPRTAAGGAGPRRAAAGERRHIPVILLDWGDTLMVDVGEFSGPMVAWPRVRAVAGAKRSLRKLRPGRRLVVATNADDSDAAAVRAALARAGLAALVDDIVSSRDVGARKPAAAFFAAALKQAGGGEERLDPADVVMVGDSWENDVAGAKAAGLLAIWLNPERRLRPEPAPGGDGRQAPDAEIASMRELPAAIRLLERSGSTPRAGRPRPPGDRPPRRGPAPTATRKAPV